MSRKVQPAYPDEVTFFAGTDQEKHVEAARTIARWDKFLDPSTHLYLTTEYVENERGSVTGRLYMEPAQDSEPWLAGVLVAFRTESELRKYIAKICDHNGREESDYSYWRANLNRICATMPKMEKDWKESEQGGIKVELHEVLADGSISFVDVLWDCTTN